MDFFMYLSSPS